MIIITPPHGTDLTFCNKQNIITKYVTDIYDYSKGNIENIKNAILNFNCNKPFKKEDHEKSLRKAKKFTKGTLEGKNEYILKNN